MIQKMMISTILVLLCPSALAMKVRPGSAPAVKFSLPRFLAGLGLTAAVTGATIAGDDLVPCDLPTMTKRPVATCQWVGKTEPTYEIHPAARGRNDDPGRPVKGKIQKAQDIFMCNNIIPEQVPVCEMNTERKNMCKKRGSRYECTDGTIPVAKCGIPDVPCRTSVTSPATPTETEVTATKSPAPKAKVGPAKGKGSVTAPSAPKPNAVPADLAAKLAASEKAAAVRRSTSDAKQTSDCQDTDLHTWTKQTKDNLDSDEDYKCKWNPAKPPTCESWCKLECIRSEDKCCGGLSACKGCSYCVPH